MDTFTVESAENSNNNEEHMEITPNIEYQLNKFDTNEYFKHKYIPEKALFTNEDTIHKLKSFYTTNCDIPLLIYGKKGIGKLTCIINLLVNIPCYLPTFNNEDKVNNINYFKQFENDYPKLLFYENIFFLNLKVLHNNTEILENLQFLYKLSKSKTFDEDEKKIIIISNIQLCNNEAQHYINFMIDKISLHSSYLFTSTTLTQIDNKIKTSCSLIGFKPLNELSFCKLFKTNFKKSFYNKDNSQIILTNTILKQFYSIYSSNNYNIGTTIAQIKYNIDVNGIEFLENKQNTISLLSLIAKKFIKTKLILSTVNSALDIRKFLYTLVSLNIDLIIFVKEVIKQLCNTKLHFNIKNQIIEDLNTLLKDIIYCNKDVIIVETFFYKIIPIIYSTNTKK
jgi:hypothetical protein